MPSTVFTLSREEVIILTINVTVRNGNLEQAMRVLKRKVQKEGIIKELWLDSFIKSHLKSNKKRKKRL